MYKYIMISIMGFHLNMYRREKNMEQIALAIVSGVVTAVLVIVVLYRRLERSMETKLKNYGDALLNPQI